MKKPITDWNVYRFQFVRERLRKASFMWPPRGQAIRAARTTQKVNPATGRLCWYVRCAGCQMEFLEKEIKLDHKQPIVDVNVGYMSGVRDQSSSFGDHAKHLGTYVLRMLPEVQGFQCLCKGCHDRKTKGENDARRANRSKGRPRKA